MFSARTHWTREPNRLSQLLQERRASGKPLYDLTVSNPTDAGLAYPAEEILVALADAGVLRYDARPLGMLRAREAVASYYAAKGVSVDPSRIVLTASTSEAYSFLFTLLCNAGDNVLVPTPSYPLFEYLAGMHDVQIRPYQLRYDGEWHMDADSLRSAVSAETKAIVVINPHNPTGMFLKKEVLAALNEIARQRTLALVVDEVFADYGLGNNATRVSTTATNSGSLTFTLNGISKSCGLPQMKLGWIAVSGEGDAVSESLHRLEFIADSYLSVNTPVQLALPRLLDIGGIVRKEIGKRVGKNLSVLKDVLNTQSLCSLLSSEGGWYAIVRVPNTRSEDEWLHKLLEESGIYVFPGYFFEFQRDGYLVLSLLTGEEVFRKGIEEMLRVISIEEPPSSHTAASSIM